MTTEREMLEYAAKACGIEIDWGMHERGNEACWHGAYEWNPLTNSADCAAMCAKLGINSRWYSESGFMACGIGKENNVSATFADHNNDREAAWRYAATMVAAKIGGMK